MISYAITVKDEFEELKSLVDILLKHKKSDDEIVIVQDISTNNEDVSNYLENTTGISHHTFEFKNNFSDLKNAMNSYCTKKWIFQLDADELPHRVLLIDLPEILRLNEQAGENGPEVIWVPRINIVNGITPEHIKKWGWTINEKGWINWPHDLQCRIYKRTPDIYWINNVHEKLTGAKRIGSLPSVEEYSIYHIKDIARQERQNNFYSTLR